MKNYCHPFDLSSCLPDAVAEDALKSGQISLFDCDSCKGQVTVHVLRQIAHLLEAEEERGNSTPIRICIPSLGSPDWGKLTLDVRPSETLCGLSFTIRRTYRISCTPSGAYSASISWHAGL